MELSTAIQKREKLEADLAELIKKFQDETTLKVTNIDFSIPIPYTGGYSNPPLFFVNVKVEI